MSKECTWGTAQGGARSPEGLQGMGGGVEVWMGRSLPRRDGPDPGESWVPCKEPESLGNDSARGGN